MKKPSKEERICRAKELVRNIKQKNTNIPEYTLEVVRNCIRCMKIDEDDVENLQLMAYEDVSYEGMPKDRNRNLTSLIFIEFTTNGCVAVVGAGEDIGFSNSSMTGEIIKSIDGVDWDRKRLLILTIKNLDAVAVSKVTKGNSIFKSRNAVEHCIGECLLQHNIPILNMYSHKNFTDSGWKKLLSSNS